MSSKWTFFIFSFHIFANVAFASKLTKQEAFETMKKNSPRWQQTILLSAEATAQTSMAESANGPHVLLTSREVVAKINQLQYGFENQGTLNYISFGNTGFAVAYSLYDAASNSRIDLAKKNQEMTDAQKEQYQSDLTFLMLAQYLQIARLNQKITNIDLNIQRDEEIVKAADMKVKVGAGVRLDQLRAKNLLEYDRIKKIDLQNQLEKAKMELAQTIGLNQFNFDVEGLKFSEFQNSNKIDIANRKDVKAAQKTIELALENKNMHVNENKPKITFFGETGLSGAHVIGGSSALTGSLGIQLSMSIFDSGLSKARVSDAEIKIKKAELQKNSVESEAESQIQMGLLQLKNADKAYELSQKQLSAAEEEMSMAQKRFQAGSSSGLEIANAQSSLANARDLYTDALFGFELAKLNYFKSLGKVDDYLKNGTQNE